MKEVVNLRGEAASLAADLGPKLCGMSEDDALKASIAALSEAGLLAWTVPAAHGGAATELCGAETVSVRALCAVRDELAYEHGVLDLAFIMQGLGSFPIALSGNADLAAEVLPKIATGECVAAFAVTEEGAGSSLGEVATTAERDGDAWKLSGTKTYISNAGVADRYTVLARTGEDETTLFSVPADEVTVERFEVMAPHPIGEVRMEGASVPDSARIGDVGTGLDLALRERVENTIRFLAVDAVVPKAGNAVGAGHVADLAHRDPQLVDVATVRVDHRVLLSKVRGGASVSGDTLSSEGPWLAP